MLVNVESKAELGDPLTALRSNKLWVSRGRLSLPRVDNSGRFNLD